MSAAPIASSRARSSTTSRTPPGESGVADDDAAIDADADAFSGKAARLLCGYVGADEFPAGLPYEVLGGHLPPWDSILLPSEAPDAPVTARNRAFSSSEDDDTSGVDAESLSGSDLEDSRPAGVLAPQERQRASAAVAAKG